MTFEIKDPPKSTQGNPKSEYNEMAETLKGYPNTWALVRTGGLYTPVVFMDRSKWRTRTHQIGYKPNIHELYVMYIGDEVK